jgi:hypothetical protein
LLAADGITVDAGGRAHSTTDGRFVAKALDYPALTATGPVRPRVRPGQYGEQTWRVTGYRPTAAGGRDVGTGPGHLAVSPERERVRLADRGDAAVREAAGAGRRAGGVGRGGVLLLPGCVWPEP